MYVYAGHLPVHPWTFGVHLWTFLKSKYVSLNPRFPGISRVNILIRHFGRILESDLDDWHYIRYEDGGEELYNLSEDPHEWNNLALNEDQANRKQQLTRFIPDDRAPAVPTGSLRWEDVLSGETSLYRPK